MIFFLIFTNHYLVKKNFIMAVPKKRTSKSKKRARKSIWLKQAKPESMKALSLAKSVLKSIEDGKTNSFVYNLTSNSE